MFVSRAIHTHTHIADTSQPPIWMRSRLHNHTHVAHHETECEWRGPGSTDTWRSRLGRCLPPLRTREAGPIPSLSSSTNSAYQLSPDLADTTALQVTRPNEVCLQIAIVMQDISTTTGKHASVTNVENSCNTQQWPLRIHHMHVQQTCPPVVNVIRCSPRCGTGSPFGTTCWPPPGS